jgi:uncharacterized protein YciI
VLFAITCLDKPDSLALRQAARAAHLSYAAPHHVAFGGPLLDKAGAPCGSLLVIEAPDLAAAEAFAAADPYAIAGLFASTTIRGFRAVFKDGELL